MAFTGFARGDVDRVWSLLAAVLHIGDVDFIDIGNVSSRPLTSGKKTAEIGIRRRCCRSSGQGEDAEFCIVQG